jgi:hypothetical protein
VQALQIAYAEDTNGDRIADVYRAASTVANWDNVLSVSLAMLIRSEKTGRTSTRRPINCSRPRRWPALGTL